MAQTPAALGFQQHQQHQQVQEYAALLQSCVDGGNLLHRSIVAKDLEQHVSLWNCLVNMYVRCGDVQVAHAVFDRMQKRNMVSWAAMIAANAQHGHWVQAFRLFRMRGPTATHLWRCSALLSPKQQMDRVAHP
ncbi:pentatricopeptide repeat-containing protein At2g33760-like isoform X2 [Selaginella moellendorffii]|uniref:pentatricopeptide repeat-containing protein At2g33760-like isoform X2 n=1 Tax=Selaginella moellendorffii TaxID=88036 RepID=UPI000D1C2755|nr:pentatricopeptide repeat-containing protein At2g33760-like isoform X2 [Selaginella moellendorffii]XP_024529612.1 pentatricopeptide repeat-containing protein At2g33760-like isoform X2 [Selaginella moellendorffii]|eukprot:XP_024522325.1 pentatricopeptide repeat-containing protein At2g33760-like isoform X2 [Selaginella moellendorffii]